MGDQVRYNRELDLIEVQSSGEVSGQVLAQSLKEVGRIHRDRGAVAVVVDASEIVSMPSAGGIHQFVLSILDLELSQKVQFAILIGDAVKAELRFLETVARNRGVLMRAFEKREDALLWLFP
jgi:hypothetical protein